MIHHRNLTHSEMLTTLHSIASHRSLIKHDALVVIILSHGSSGAIFESDNRPIAFEHLLTIFNNQNCPLLIKKPKMFFFNCCRGSAQDFGPKITTRTLNGSFNQMKSYQSELELTSSGEDDVIDSAMFPHVPTVSDMVNKIEIKLKMYSRHLSKSNLFSLNFKSILLK